MVDVPFALFFLSQMLDHHYTTSYSCLDELPSMDTELYKSLSYVKVTIKWMISLQPWYNVFWIYYATQHTNDDVADLCLTFSWDEDFMGKVRTCYRPLLIHVHIFNMKSYIPCRKKGIILSPWACCTKSSIPKWKQVTQGIKLSWEFFNFTFVIELQLLLFSHTL